MSVLSTGLAKTSAATGYDLEQSLRFNDDDSAYLSRTPGTATSNDIMTYSVWMKGNLSIDTKVLVRYTSSDNRGYIGFGASGKIYIYQKVGTIQSYYLRSAALHRDPSAWYHFVFAFDTTQATASDRIKVYVNGVQMTTWENEAYPSQNQDLYIQSATSEVMKIGQYDSSQYFDGYLAEVHFIDGTALDQTSFGETGDYGEWKPIKYAGTYGTNGFYLPFNNDYTVEGFSATTYTGNGSTQYIGGTGFQPDLCWIKRRNSTDWHQITDSVRGTNSQLFSNDASAQDNATDKITSFNTDGFNISTHTGVNASGGTYVAWSWDMGGSYGLPSALTAVSTAQHSTDQKKIGTTSMKFDGASSKINVYDDGDFNFGSKDFTIEWWQYRTGTVGSGQKRGIWRHAYGNTYAPTTTDDEGTMRCYMSSNNSSWDLVNGLSLGSTVANSWHHYAIVRDGSTISSYKDGAFVASTTSSSSVYSYSGDGRVGSDNNYAWEGFIDEFRISNKARYTSNFTAFGQDGGTISSPTAFTSDANTLLLIHSNTTNGSTTFTDSSGAAKNTEGTITSNVAANPTYGQSIVSYTGTAGVSDATKIGHGLSAAPEMIIIRDYENAQYWPVWHKDMHTDGGFDRKMYLNDTGGVSGTDQRRVTSVSTTTFGLPEGATSGGYSESNHIGAKHIAYCFHSVSGYSKIGSYSGNGSTTGPVVTTGFKPAFLMIKETVDGGGWLMVDNTRNPTNPTTLRLNANTSGAEDTSADNNVDFNDTGFQIKTSSGSWNQNGVTIIYMCFADKREAAFWLDQSGNNNDWTGNNLTESDISLDSPTNNFCTLNPLLYPTSQGGNTMKEGNLRYGNGSDWSWTQGTMMIPKDQVVYFEMYGEGSSASTYGGVSLQNNQTYSAGSRPDGYINGLMGSLPDNLDWYFYNRTTGGSSTTTSVSGNYMTSVIGVVVDQANSTVKFYADGVLKKTLTDSNSFTTTGDYVPFAGGGNNRSTIINFGQDSSFAGAKTAQGNQDANGYGDFYYTPPAGVSLCTKNLPDPAVIPSEHFNTVTYTGNASARSISGVGFQPDFLWIKGRTGTQWHMLFDAIRGNTKELYTNDTSAEATTSTTLTSFDTDGFSTGADNDVNRSGTPFVAWNWKANGTGVSNTSGSINSTVSANADAGFSIVSYTGTGVDDATVGHGLSKAPEMVIIKNRIDALHWFVHHQYHGGTPEYRYRMLLNETSAKTYDTGWLEANPTSTVFQLGTSGYTNGTSDGMIAYCFHSVDGYSKVGSWTSNNSADGTFVYTGFKPRYIMSKQSDNSGDWVIFDTERNTYNESGAYLEANTSDAEDSARHKVDILSNGFKARSSYGEFNGYTSSTQIFIAFAEVPFKYSTAR